MGWLYWLATTWHSGRPMAHYSLPFSSSPAGPHHVLPVCSSSPITYCLSAAAAGAIQQQTAELRQLIGWLVYIAATWQPPCSGWPAVTPTALQQQAHILIGLLQRRAAPLHLCHPAAATAALPQVYNSGRGAGHQLPYPLCFISRRSALFTCPAVATHLNKQICLRSSTTL